jgi:hypothetical protein
MPSWIVRIIFDDFAGDTRIPLFNFIDRNLIGITLLFRMQLDPIPALCQKHSQAFKHAPTLLKLTAKCNQLAHEVRSEDHLCTAPSQTTQHATSAISACRYS